MIKETTISELVERLDTAHKALGGNRKPDATWMKDTENLIYDVRTDIDKGNWGFDELVSKEAYDEVQAENDELHDRILDLESELEEAEA